MNIFNFESYCIIPLQNKMKIQNNEHGFSWIFAKTKLLALHGTFEITHFYVAIKNSKVVQNLKKCSQYQFINPILQ